VLDWLPGDNMCEAYAINNASPPVVVGYSNNVFGEPMRACMWVDGEVNPIPLPIGPNSVAFDVNQSGQIVGWMGNSPGGSFYAEGFCWTDGKVRALGIPEGGTSSRATAISNSGLVCGVYIYPNPAGGTLRHGVLWTQESMIPLGVLNGFSRSFALDVNDSGYVVGYCEGPPAVKAFIWHDGVMTAIKDLLMPDSSQYQVWQAFAINESNDIAGVVYTSALGSRIALLTPVPPVPGDTNCDWLVNVDDLLNIINAWGPYENTSGGGSGTPDVNDNHVVDVDDLLMVISNWG